MRTSKPKVSIIGAGNVGTSLLKHSAETLKEIIKNIKL